LGFKYGLFGAAKAYQSQRSWRTRPSKTAHRLVIHPEQPANLGETFPPHPALATLSRVARGSATPRFFEPLCERHAPSQAPSAPDRALCRRLEDTLQMARSGLRMQWVCKRSSPKSAEYRTIELISSWNDLMVPRGGLHLPRPQPLKT